MNHKQLLRVLITLLILSLLPAPVQHAAAAETTAAVEAAGAEETADSADSQPPEKPVLVSVTSPAFDRITLTWKKAAGATRYFICRKEEGSDQWKQIAVLSGEKCSYTHISSADFPIAVGRKYTYTVISYSSRSKKRGEFDAGGLTVMTRPDPVKLGRAVWNEDRTEVTLTWNKSGGATAYLVYRRTNDEPKWTRLTALAADAVKYVDPSPDPDGKNIYTVLSYNLDAKVSGQYDKSGVQPVTQQEAQTADLAKTLQATATASKTGQIILVVDHNLSFWEKSSDGSWSRKMSVYCGYGSKGLCDDRTEGDRTTPIGSFPILHGFGIADNPGSTMQYKKITSNSYWSGEQSTYNQWVESPRRISGEHLIDYYQYKYAMAIGFNINPTVYKKGSAIFLHCKSYDHWSTAGCVSVEEHVMKELLQMSHNGAYIIIVKDQEDISKY